MHPIFLQVLRTAVGHRLAKVQGYLFRAAFLRRVPTFTRLIIENLLLCFLQSTIYQTSKYLTGSLGLCFKKILTDLVHADYFEVCWVIKLESINRLHSLLLFFLSRTRRRTAHQYIKKKKKGWRPPKMLQLIRACNRPSYIQLTTLLLETKTHNSTRNTGPCT